MLKKKLIEPMQNGEQQIIDFDNISLIYRPEHFERLTNKCPIQKAQIINSLCQPTVKCKWMELHIKILRQSPLDQYVWGIE